MQANHPVASSSSVTLDDDASSSIVNGSSRPKKRGRTGVACFECRRKKIKCNNQTPCDQCITRGESNICAGGKEAITGNGSAALHLQAILNDESLSRSFIPASSSSLQFLSSRVAQLETSILARLAKLEQAVFVETKQFTAKEGMDGMLPPIGYRERNGPGHATATGSPSYSDTMEEALAELEETTLVTMEGRHEPSRPTTSHDVPPDPTTWPSIYSITSPSPSTPYDFLFQINSPPLPWSNVHSVLLAQLPPVPILATLLSFYRTHLDVYWHVLHGPSFDTECSQLTFELENPRQDVSIDLMWLSCLFAALSLTVTQLDQRTTDILGWDTTVRMEVSAKLLSASQFSLASSGWMENPCVRALQAILLICGCLPHRGSPFTPNPHLSGISGRRNTSTSNDCRPFDYWLLTAVRLGRQLGLDQLSDEPQNMPRNDRAWPSGVNALKRQLACRLWTHLVTLDRKTSRNGDSLLIAHGSYTTPHPTRCQDRGLETVLVATEASPLESSAADTILFQNFLSNHIRRVASYWSTPKASVNYTMVLDLDNNLRNCIKRLLGVEVGEVVENGELVAGNMERKQLSSALHNQVLRLHRPFFFQALQQRLKPAPSPNSTTPPAHLSSSTLICLTSARAVLSLYRSSSSPSADAPKSSSTSPWWWWQVAHAFSASIILSLGRLFLQTDPASSEDQTEEKGKSDDELVQIGLRLLESISASTQESGAAGEGGATSLMATRSAQVVRALLRLQEQQQSRSDQYDLPLEQVLKLISDDLLVVEDERKRRRREHEVGPGNAAEALVGLSDLSLPLIDPGSSVRDDPAHFFDWASFGFLDGLGGVPSGGAVGELDWSLGFDQGQSDFFGAEPGRSDSQ
ncbi:hypothetical protein T439DRAFT_323355 [Meredithblackwellia eburnea MCA 4105]